MKKCHSFITCPDGLHACGTTAFTGRKQLLVYSDESVSALSDESYANFMKTAVVSDDVMHKNMVRSVGSVW